jgi:hypothetical protein
VAQRLLARAHFSFCGGSSPRYYDRASYNTYLQAWSVSWFFAGASNLLFTQSRAMWPILPQEKQVICLDTEGDLWEKVLFRGVVSFLTTCGSRGIFT